jgi:hypothetical protein
VLFEVSNISYHEVAMAKQDGRRSITGWLNKKEAGALRPKKVIPPYQPSIPKNIIKFKLQPIPDRRRVFSASQIWSTSSTWLVVNQLVLSMKEKPPN